MRWNDGRRIQNMAMFLDTGILLVLHYLNMLEYRKLMWLKGPGDFTITNSNAGFKILELLLSLSLLMSNGIRIKFVVTQPPHHSDLELGGGVVSLSLQQLSSAASSEP